MSRGLRIGLVIASSILAAGAAQAQSWRENYDAGKRLFEQGRYVEADKLMTAALKQAANSSDQYVTLNQLSLIRHALGEYDEAIDLGKRALSGAESLGEQIAIGYCLNNLGLFLWSKGRTQDAEPYLKKALETLERASDKDPTVPALTTNNVGNLYYNKGRWKEAAEYWHAWLGDARKKRRCAIRWPAIRSAISAPGTGPEASGKRAGSTSPSPRPRR